MLDKYCDFSSQHSLSQQFYFISDHKILLELFRCFIATRVTIFGFCFFDTHAERERMGMRVTLVIFDVMCV